MEENYLVGKLKEWDFKTNSKKSFSETYNISIRTIDRYINKYNIDYDKRQFGVKSNRNKYGQYILAKNQPVLTKTPKETCLRQPPGPFEQPILMEKQLIINKGARSFADMDKNYKYLF